MTELLALLTDDLGVTAPLQGDTPLLSSGLIDSFRFGALLTMLETRYGIAIDPREVGADNFDTAAQILHFIRARR
jgi:acyl carrier protein